MTKNYPSKVLLFGEYTVLFGGTAFAIPYEHFSGHWTYKAGSSHELKTLFDHLVQVNSQLIYPIALDSLEEALHQGLHFSSDIPIGMGLGSSAALSAAVYDRFTSSRSIGLNVAMSDLSIIEGLYHGKSSGFDALVSYLNKPVLYKKGDLQLFDQEPYFPMYVYLLSTFEMRSSEQLISWYRSQLTNPIFSNKMKFLTEVSELILNKFLQRESDVPSIRQMMDLQWTFLRPLISDRMLSVWKKIESVDHMAIKLCGAGGGGYYLVFSELVIKDPQIEGYPLTLLAAKGGSIRSKGVDF